MLQIGVNKRQYIIEYHKDLDDENSEVLATFTVEPMTPTELQDIMNRYKYYEWDSPGKKIKKERFETYNFLKITYDRLVKIIKNWDGVVNSDGKVLECNRDNKIIAFEHNPELINWVLEKADEIQNMEIDKQKDLEKNLETGRVGKAGTK
jgi:hypothetical protein